MNVSIFTPTNNSKFLPEVYRSIRDQDFHEWIVVYNNGGIPIEFQDSRVKSYMVDYIPPWVGALKSFACDQASGDILLELDHDDILIPEAIEEVKKAFQNENIGFVYSNSVRATIDFKPLPRFSDGYGWQYREYRNNGYLLDEYVAFDPTPSSVSKIWFAPDHLRAFRRDIYKKSGGYDKEMRILDDQDLMCRLYREAEFKHIDKPLYIYRVHGENAWLKYNREIQDNVYRLYDKYIDDLVDAWATRHDLRRIELGGRFHARKGFETIDLKDCDIQCDLNGRWNLEDNSVGVIRAIDIFEHLIDPIHVMRELYRVLAPGGYAMIKVPSTDGRGAFQDPTHKSFWNENSFLYYTDKEWAKFIDIPVRFQPIRLYTTDKNKIGACWTIANLVKLVDGMRVPDLVKI